MIPNLLELALASRSPGSGITPRTFLDFVVDGVSLSNRFKGGDWVTPIGWTTAESERMYLEQLTLLAPPETPSGRVPIYVCPECGDLGCGAISARITRKPEGFVWSEFAYENDYDPAPLETYGNVGPFLFDKALYWQTLTTKVASR